MRKNYSVLLFFLGLLIVAGTVIFIANPLLRSEEKIREKLLIYTSLGTKMEDVIKYIESNKTWKVIQISYEHGFYDQRTLPNKTVGEKSIRVSLGDYRFILETNVTVFWGFDENSKLIDIWVWKTTDGP